MAVTILRYPGGLEYPEQFRSNVQGLTPIGSYTLSDEVAIARFPGLQYSLKPSSSTSPAAPTTQSSSISIQATGSAEPTTTALAALGGDANSNKQSVSTQQNLAIIEQQAEEGNTDSQEFLKIYTDKNLNNTIPSQVQDQQLESKEQQIAQALPLGPSGMDRAPGTYHPSNIIPLQTPGSNWRPGEGYMIQNPFERSPRTGPGLSQGPRGEVTDQVAQVRYQSKPTWQRTLEQDYQRNINKPINSNPVRNSGRGNLDTWEGPVKEASAPVFDEQKATIAKQAAGEYRRRGQVEDPFRASAIG
jgi:hypothetical protein